jgi:hypothetical protein
MGSSSALDRLMKNGNSFLLRIVSVAVLCSSTHRRDNVGSLEQACNSVKLTRSLRRPQRSKRLWKQRLKDLLRVASRRYAMIARIHA